MTRHRRRDVLRAAVVAGMASALPRKSPGDDPQTIDWRDRIIRYLESHTRADGGYGWEGQQRAHLTPTFAVVGCYKLLGREPPNKAALAKFIRTHHPRELKKLEQEHRAFDWQQIQALVWLGEDVSDFRGLVQSWKAPFAYPKQYERHGYPVFQQEIAPILCRKLVSLPMDRTPPALIDYVNSRRRANGSFNSTPTDDGSQGHVLNTWWGLQALVALAWGGKAADPLKTQTADWLQRCQIPKGGFTYQPQPADSDTQLFGGWEDIAYTWAAVRSLRLLDAQPSDVESCIRYIKRLFTFDGGFGDRQGWLANPLATFYALDSLAALDQLLPDLVIGERFTPWLSVGRPMLPGGLKVFSIQIEAHGQGSPAEAVDLADQLRIHLWGAKNSKPGWLRRAQTLAPHDLRFFIANEDYGTWIDVPGLGTYSHMSDVIGSARDGTGESLAGQTAFSWTDFVARRIAPLVRKNGRLIWQFGENEPLVRMLLDDSLQRHGFAAISTYHFGNPDFTNSDPMLMRYRGQIPFIALQDAHGGEPWWFADMTEGFRTLFLGNDPTWAGWLSALKNNWVVAVRHDAVSGGETWMHGMPEVVDVVKKQWRSWQWWDNPAIKRPVVSIVAIKPDDEFEVGRPEKGVAIRVRCAWRNTTQGLPKTQLTELVKLMVAGKQVRPEHVIRRRPNDAIEDDYYIYNWPDAPAGQYTASATVRDLATGEETWRPIQFTI